MTAPATTYTDRVAAWAPATQAILRIGAAILFIQHGVQKLFGWLGGVGPQGGTVELMSMFGAAGVIELVGGLLLLVGLLTRPVAAIAFVEMVAAYFIAHFPQGGWPVQNQGELALLYAFVWLFFALNGPGPWSVDGAIRGRRTAA